MDDYTILGIIIGAPRTAADKLIALLQAPDMQALRALIVELTPARPWWQMLVPRTAGATTWDRVSPAADGVLIRHGDGQVWKTAAMKTKTGDPVIWDVYDIDSEGGRIQVLDIRPGFPTGLYVSAADCGPASKGGTL